MIRLAKKKQQQKMNTKNAKEQTNVQLKWFLLIRWSAKNAQKKEEDVNDVDVENKSPKHVFFRVQFVLSTSHYQLRIKCQKLKKNLICMQLARKVTWELSQERQCLDTASSHFRVFHNLTWSVTSIKLLHWNIEFQQSLLQEAPHWTRTRKVS